MKRYPWSDIEVIGLPDVLPDTHKVPMVIGPLLRIRGTDLVFYPVDQDGAEDDHGVLGRTETADLHVDQDRDEITLFANRTTKATYAERDDGKYDVTIEIECQKYQADEHGKETEVALDDWIEIGAFAEPEKDRKYGATLHRERVKITQPTNTFTFTVNELPEKAGVVPFALLIDRIPDDNMKKVRKAG